MTSTILFIIAAIISIFAANRLSAYADIISRETKIGGMAAGTLLLAVATSLPELTSTISAAVIGNAAIVVGNGLGSILFNIFMLFLLDLHFRQKRLFLEVESSHKHTGSISLVLCAMSAIFLLIDTSGEVWGIAWASVLMILTYLGGTWMVSRRQGGKKDKDAVNPEAKRQKSVKPTIIWFIIMSAVIFVSGSTLSITGDQIAQTTGISATAVGSILIALTTSLPDAVSVYTALRLSNVNLAIGAILGSNMFNIFIIPLSDFFYVEGSVWADAGDQNILIAVVGFLLTVIVMVVLTRQKARNTFTYILPSLLAVICYIIVVGVVLFV